jgi:O-antigen/teichoic acid export membrane protein
MPTSVDTIAKTSRSFSKDVLVMASAPITTQIINLLLTPILVRLYSPADFGVFQLFNSLMTPLLVFATFGYNVPILLESNNDETEKLIQLNLLLAFCYSFFIAIVIFIIKQPLKEFLHLQILENLFWIIPVTIFFHGLYLTFRYWNLKHYNFRTISTGEIIRNISSYAVTLPAGFLGRATPAMLIYGSLFTSIAVPYILIKKAIRSEELKFFTKVHFEKICALAKRYKKFPIYNTSIDLFSRFSSELPIYLMAIYFSQEIIGFYALGLRLLRIPISYIGNALGEVYFQRSAQDKGNMVSSLEKILRYIILLTLPLFVFLSFTGKELFAIVFGSRWTESGVYAEILSLYTFIKLITNQAIYLANIFERLKYYLIFVICDAIVISAAILIGGLLQNVYISLFLTLIVSGSINLFFGFSFYSYAGLNWRPVLSLFLKALIQVLLLSLLLILTKYYFNLSSTIFVKISIAGFLIYYYYLVKVNSELSKTIIKYYRSLISKVD